MNEFFENMFAEERLGLDGIKGTRDDFNRLFDMLKLGENDTLRFKVCGEETFIITVKREGQEQEKMVYDSYYDQIFWDE